MEPLARYTALESWFSIFPAILLTLIAALLPFAYRLTIHPLARYPGPRLWALSRIPYVLSMRAGTLAHDIQAFHARYGPVVRLAPTELSFTDAAAAKDIYAGAHPFPKNPIWFSPPSSGRAASLLNAGPEDHARMRRAWGYGFSERALREQEPLIRDVVDQLVERLRQRAECGQEADMTTLFNYTVFDIVGSLAFGESFDCLANDAYHAWVGLIVFHFKTAVLMTACSYFPWLYRGLRLLVPASARAKQAEHFGRAQAKVRKRLAAKVDRPDLLAHLARSRKGLTEAEIEATAAQIIVAGSDTLTTTLTGTLSYLLRFPETMKRVQGEIRQAFEREEDIVLVRLEKLPYLGAVIDEGLRIVSPVPLGMSRVVPEGGGMVCGEVIAGGTQVAYPSWAAGTSITNFARPLEFHPERWLPEAKSNSQSEYFNDHLEASQPFSVGLRNCIGKNLAYFEVRLILSRVLFRFDIELGKEYDSAPRWEEQKTFAIWEKRPLWVRLTESQLGARNTAGGIDTSW